ncbi:MAG: hypothetical protein D6681_21750 [Calditrichaeota bacterium]|nr:MAG: hypothetical protein D6681_21750 [Calditrichota bacterium]
MLGLSLPGWGGEVTKVGTTAAPFLTIGVGARPLAMGGAFVSVANDASALFWNVSGIAQLERPEMIFNHSEWLEEINFDYLGLTVPLGTFGTVGLSITAMTMGEFEQTTELQPEGTGVMFSAGSFAAAVSYGRRLTDKFMIGFTGKFIREYIWNSSATGVALDVGTLFITPFNDLRLGMSISNFGTKMRISGDDLLLQVDPDPTISGNNNAIPARFLTDKFDLPLLFRVGASMEVMHSETSRLTLSVDALHPNDNAESVNVGGEYAFQETFYLRGGYRSLFLPDSEEGFTVGAGLGTRLGTLRFRFDYAYEDFGLLGSIQKITARLRF